MEDEKVKVQLIICDKCKKAFTIHPLSRWNKEMLVRYFVCTHCGKVYLYGVESAELAVLRNKRDELRAKYILGQVSYSEVKKASDEFHALFNAKLDACRSSEEFS